MSISLIGCQIKTKIAEIEAISMTHEVLAPGESLESRGPISARYCVDSLRDRGSIGLLDEAAANAQAENNIDFITAATLYRIGGGCYELSGTGQVVVAAVKAPVTRSSSAHAPASASRATAKTRAVKSPSRTPASSGAPSPPGGK